MLEQRLAALADWLSDKNNLEGRLSAADLMMICVLRELQETDVLPHYPTSQAYKNRCETRPALARVQARMAPLQEDAST